MLVKIEQVWQETKNGTIACGAREIISVDGKVKSARKPVYGHVFVPKETSPVVGDVYEVVGVTKLASETPFYDDQTAAPNGLYYNTTFRTTEDEAIHVDAAALRQQRAARAVVADNFDTE